MRPRKAAFLFFYSIMAAATSTILVIALTMIRFLSGSLLAAMGDACSGLFRASQGFLASSRWNYLLVVGAAAVFLLQGAFLLGGGARMFRVSSRFKKMRIGSSTTCPALKWICRSSWAPHTYLVSSESPDAQTAGIFRPRILINRGLLNVLSRNELEVVMAHEEAHRSGRDNLLMAIAKAASIALFYLPGIRMAFREMCLCLEKAADEKAADHLQDPYHVASVLIKIIKLSGPPQATASLGSDIFPAVSGGRHNDISARLENLINWQAVSRRRLRMPLAFAVISCLTLFSFSASAYAVTGAGQRDAFVCFSEHAQEMPASGVCELDHPNH